jgi:hypothetical protein
MFNFFKKKPIKCCLGIHDPQVLIDGVFVYSYDGDSSVEFQAKLKKNSNNIKDFVKCFCSKCGKKFNNVFIGKP